MCLLHIVTIDTCRSSHIAESYAISSCCNFYLQEYFKLLDHTGAEKSKFTCKSFRSSKLETTIVTSHSCVFKQPISLFTAFRNAKDGSIHSTTDGAVKSLTEAYLLLRNNPPLPAIFERIKIKSTELDLCLET